MTSLHERFTSKHETTPDGCWLWFAATDNHGYGIIKHQGKVLKAHRVSHELHVGPIPAGLDIDHLCRVRHCVNPEHLQPVTRRENVLRGEGLAAAHAVKTHCPQGHEYDEANTYRSPANRRLCRACDRARSLRKRSRCSNDSNTA